jgi:hypothetical protein
MISDIVKVANRLTIIAKRKTVSHQELQSAVYLTLPKKLTGTAIYESSNAVTRFKASIEGENRGSMSMATRAELLFSVSRVRKLMLTQVSPKGGRIGRTGPIVMTAVIENMVRILLEAARNVSRMYHQVRITNRHLMVAISMDESLNELYSKKYIVGGGVRQGSHLGNYWTA